MNKTQLKKRGWTGTQIKKFLGAPDWTTGKRSGTGRKTEGDRSGKSLHICRGHFSHYANDGTSLGLFGRGTTYGTFWIPSHARGSLEHGRIVSTYKIA